jgi:hypothetical protein
LHEGYRKRRHADVADRIGLIRPVTPVGQCLAAYAQALDQGLEAVHTWVEAYIAPVSVGSIDGQPRVFPPVRLWRLTHP